MTVDRFQRVLIALVVIFVVLYVSGLLAGPPWPPEELQDWPPIPAPK